ADAGEQLNGQYELIVSNYRYINDLLEEDPRVLAVAQLLKDEKPNPQFALYTLPALERRLKRLNELIELYKKEVVKIKDVDKVKEREKQVEAMNKLATLREKQANLNLFTEKLAEVMEKLTAPDDADSFIRDDTSAN